MLILSTNPLCKPWCLGALVANIFFCHKDTKTRRITKNNNIMEICITPGRLHPFAQFNQVALIGRIEVVIKETIGSGLVLSELRLLR